MSLQILTGSDALPVVKWSLEEEDHKTRFLVFLTITLQLLSSPSLMSLITHLVYIENHIVELCN